MARNKAYRIAEQKIEESRRSGAIKLDLSGGFDDKTPKLSELPESVGQLPKLQSLDLNNNELAALPESVGQLTQLQVLNLGNNQLTALPETLGLLTNIRKLNLSYNQLTALPETLGQITHIQELNLTSNQLTALPKSLGQLTQLRTLKLSSNRLTELPKWLGQLMGLQELGVSDNPLVSLSESLGKLTQLQDLNIGYLKLEQVPEIIRKLTQLTELSLAGNCLDTLPTWFEELRRLEQLYLYRNDFTTVPPCIATLNRLALITLNSNELTEIPDWFGRLQELREVYLDHNTLHSLPSTLANLPKLKMLDISSNPLNPELRAAHREGLEGIKRYLREIAKGGRDRYEAKLLILGDGNEGKTCVSRALRGLPFRIQRTTRGVDVVQWKFPHPDDDTDREKEITLNIWDFEGQEISHQTHQFFLTAHSLYLLVFKCRDQFLLDRAEYWLDTIRARAPKAKVAIVISQCEERLPHIPLDKIQAQYADMLPKEWFFPVGCENGKNIERLRIFLRRSAADLEFMGAPWPKSYQKAEESIKAKSVSHITRERLDGILRKARVSDDNYEGAATSLARIGAITQFPDCPDLRDFVVLKPQWLTKAISKVMEDGQLTDDKGEISLKRMERIWSKAPGYRGMFAIFHDCMKEFELCYDLEDHGDSCLVPLRFGYVAPTIPWTKADEFKQRKMEYKLNVRPPMGIMSRFIVKTHHLIVTTAEYPKGIYWHNGVFLRTNSPCPSEALCEFLPDERIFRVIVSAAFPQNMCEQIHGYIQAVFSFFGGLSAERSYGCIKVDAETGAESQCRGLYTERRIYTAISKQRETLDCEFEDHEVDPRLLVSGISSFGGFVETRLRAILRQEIDKAPEWAEPFLGGIGTLVEWVNHNGSKLDQLLEGQATLAEEFKQEAELKLHEYLACMSQMLDDRDHTAAPGLISITTKERSRWNPARYFNSTYVLTPYCECEGNIHACDDGSVEFIRDRDWWRATAPWIARATKVLAVGLQLGFAGMPLMLSSEVIKEFEAQVKFMEELSKHLELEAPEESKNLSADRMMDGDVGKDLRGNDRDAALTRSALSRFLEETAPDNYRARRWGSLVRKSMSDNSYRWLCETCAARAH